MVQTKAVGLRWDPALADLQAGWVRAFAQGRRTAMRAPATSAGLTLEAHRLAGWADLAARQGESFLIAFSRPVRLRR
jgi:hypothetical protein